MDHINSNFKKFIFQNCTNLVDTFNYNLKNIEIKKWQPQKPTLKKQQELNLKLE